MTALCLGLVIAIAKRGFIVKVITFRKLDLCAMFTTRKLCLRGCKVSMQLRARLQTTFSNNILLPLLCQSVSLENIKY